MQPIWRSCRLWELFVRRAGVSATVMLVALAAVITAGDASAAGAAEPRLPSPIVELEPQRARLLAEIQCQPTVGKWLQLAEVQEELGRRYAWGVEEELGAARETAESAETAKSRPLGRSATSPLTPQPSNPSGGNPQPPDWSALERRTLEVLRCYDGYIEALEKAGELARRRIQEEGDLRPDLVEKYRRLLTELGPVLAQARANRPVVEAGRKVRLRVIGACRRFYAQPNPANARDCLQAFVLGLDRPEGLSPPMLGWLVRPPAHHKSSPRVAGRPADAGRPIAATPAGPDVSSRAAAATQPGPTPPGRLTDTGWRSCTQCGQPCFAGWGSPRNVCDKCDGTKSGGAGHRKIFDFGPD